MWIANRATLHVVDLDTNFNAAIFLKTQISEGVWDAFVTCWASLYIGFSLKMRVHQRISFTSVRWTRRADAVGTIVQTSDVEANNAIGA